jgi:hypothetical protein
MCVARISQDKDQRMTTLFVLQLCKIFPGSSAFLFAKKKIPVHFHQQSVKLPSVEPLLTNLRCGSMHVHNAQQANRKPKVDCVAHIAKNLSYQTPSTRFLATLRAIFAVMLANFACFWSQILKKRCFFDEC